MPARRTRGKRPLAQERAERSDRNSAGRFKQINVSSARIVEDAAALLNEEVAAGILAAKQVQGRFQKERRIDPGDFKQALEKFQGDAHQVVNLLFDQITGLGSETNTDVAKRLLHNAHDVVDFAVQLVNMGAEIADQLARSNPGRDAGNGRKRSR